MADDLQSSASRKRSLPALEVLLDDEAPKVKRACLDLEISQSSPTHLILLEELCDLEGEDAESCVGASAANSFEQEDLVAEMMKSLEKVIEEGETRGSCEPSISQSVGVKLGSPAPTGSLVADLSWTDGGGVSAGYEVSSESVLQGCEDAFLERDERIQLLLQASDEELGISTSCSSSDLGDVCSFQEWTSLLDGDGGLAAAGSNWMDMSLTHLEEARDLFEPIVLF